MFTLEDKIDNWSGNLNFSRDWNYDARMFADAFLELAKDYYMVTFDDFERLLHDDVWTCCPGQTPREAAKSYIEISGYLIDLEKNDPEAYKNFDFETYFKEWEKTHELVRVVDKCYRKENRFDGYVVFEENFYLCEM